MPAGDQRYLGAHPTEEGTNFAIWAAAAKRVELCFFDFKGGKLVEMAWHPENEWDKTSSGIPFLLFPALI